MALRLSAVDPPGRGGVNTEQVCPPVPNADAAIEQTPFLQISLRLPS